MRPVYTDLYALFRRDPGAEEYFNQLPAYVQDQLSPAAAPTTCSSSAA